MIQYFHQQKNPERFTIALDVPEKETLLELISIGADRLINIPIGITFVNPKDRYVKSIGRQISSSRMRTQCFELVHISYKDDAMFLLLYKNDLTIMIRLFPNGFKPHFINATFNEET